MNNKIIASLMTIFVLVIGMPLALSQQETEPKTLDVSLNYGANQQFPNEFNIDILIQNAKEQYFWIRTGTEPNTVYYKGSTVCSNQACSFYKEDEFFKGNRLYAYSDNTFVLYVERNGYEYQISRHKDDMTNILIGVTPKANIETNAVKDDISSMFLTLGLFKNHSDISFTFFQGNLQDNGFNIYDMSDSTKLWIASIIFALAALFAVILYRLKKK